MQQRHLSFLNEQRTSPFQKCPELLTNLLFQPSSQPGIKPWFFCLSFQSCTELLGVFSEKALSPASFSQSLNFASRISFLPFCISFVPVWTRPFWSSSWKPVQTPMRSAALALAVKSPCHPPWSHSPSCHSSDFRTQLQAWSVVLQRSLLPDCGRDWVPGVCSCLAFPVVLALVSPRPGPCSVLCT